jgi:hypothetical protein
MPFFERNSFARRQLLQPGWVNKINESETLSISMELDATLYLEDLSMTAKACNPIPPPGVSDAPI